MQNFINLYNDIIYNIQQLIYQPASRRTAVVGVGAGFTIVELLIVIVVIGILAAIVIVAFNGIQNQAHDSAVKADLKNMATVLERQKIQSTNDSYPTSLTASLGIKLTKESYSRGYFNGTAWYNVYYCRVPSGDSAKFALVAESKSGAVWRYSDGTVRPHGYTLSGSATTCSRAGVDTTATGYSARFAYTDEWLF